MDMCFFPSKESIVADKILSLLSKIFSQTLFCLSFTLVKERKHNALKKHFAISYLRLELE